MKRLHVLLGMLVLVAGWWGWVAYRKAEAAREATRGVRGRVVDVHGDPVRGCAVTVEDRDTRKAARTTTTRRDGTFEVEFWPGELGGLQVVARAEGCAPTEGQLPTPRKDFAPMPDLVVMPGGPLRGRLVGDDGRPRAGVKLRVATRPIMWWASSWDLQVVTADDGAFVVPDLVEAGWWFVAADGVRIQPFGVLVAPGADQIVNLVASEQAVDAAIHGRIVDDQGEAVPGVECRATVMVEEDVREPIAVDAEGRFVLEHFTGTPRGPVTLRAKCPGYRDAELSGVQWGARDVELVVPRAPRVRVRVVDAAGAPVPGVSVCIGWGRYVDPESASKTDEDGIDVLPAESPGRQTVRLNYPDTLREAAFVELDLADGASRAAVLEVAEGQRRQVLVRWANGAPAADVNLELGLVPAARPDDPPVSAAERFDRWVDIDSATTDAAGSAEVLGHPTARYVLRVEAPGRREFFAECRIGTGAEPLVIDLGASASVRGTLRPVSIVQQLREFAADASTVVMLQRVDKEGSRRAEGRVEADGSFSIPGVEPGDWRLCLWYRDRTGLVSTEPLAMLTGLRDGETREVPLDVSGLVRRSLAGIVTVNGKPHVGEIVVQVERQGADGQAHTLAYDARTDARGRFRHSVLSGRCRVLARVCEAAGSLAWVPSEFVATDPLTRARIEFRVEAVAVDVVTVRADGTRVDATWYLVGAEEGYWRPYVAPGTSRALLAPGRHEVGVRRAALLDHGRFVAWIRAGVDRGLRRAGFDLDVAAGEIVVPAGQAHTRVEIVLPEAAGY